MNSSVNFQFLVLAGIELEQYEGIVCQLNDQQIADLQELIVKSKRSMLILPGSRASEAFQTIKGCEKDCYDSMSVIEVVEKLLGIIPDSQGYDRVRYRLKEVIREIFIELPEDRLKLLCRVGAVINEEVKREDSYAITKPCWNQVREILNACFKRFR